MVSFCNFSANEFGSSDIKLSPMLLLLIFSLSRESTKDFLDEIEKSDVLYQYDPQLWNIVQSETNGFFNGQNSAQQTAQAIQSKANLYLAEQK